MKKDFPYSSVFASTIRPLVSEERDKYLALASLMDVSRFVPDLDTDSNYDLLPIAFNACVVNRINKNGDVIDSATAVSNYKNFINKPINLEHNRQVVIGVILTAGFSEFGTDAPLTEEQVANKKEPFNITLGGILWRVVSPKVCEEVEESNDPTSPSYLGVSASWELGFKEYDILLLEDGLKNIEAGEVISDEKMIEALKSKLKSFGGDNKDENGKRVYRMPKGFVLPLGVGLTSNPAADVIGVAIKEEANAAVDDQANKNSEKNISHSVKSHVNSNDKIMKITAISDITDESIKQISASAITDFLNTEIKKADSKWQDDKNKLDNELKAAKDAREELIKKQAEIEDKQKQLEKSLAEYQAKEADRLKVEKFNSRMAEVDNEYELDEALSKIVAGQIKLIESDEQFDAWKADAAVLFKAYSKTEKKNKADAEAKARAEAEELSKKEQEAKAKKDAEEALAKSKEQKGGLPNSMTPNPNSLIEKYKEAFSMKEGFIIQASQFKV